MGHWIHVLWNCFFSTKNDIICKNKYAASASFSSRAWKWEKYEEKIPTCLIASQIKALGNNSWLGEIQMRNMITALCRGKAALGQNVGCFFLSDPSARAWLARAPWKGQSFLLFQQFCAGQGGLELVQLLPWGVLMSFYVHQAELRALCGPVQGNSKVYGKKKDINLHFLSRKTAWVFTNGAAGEVFVYK